MTGIIGSVVVLCFLAGILAALGLLPEIALLYAIVAGTIGS